MRRHEFQPGRLLAGLVLVAAGVLYLLDATGEADLPWFLVIPMTMGGLCLAALVGVVTYAVRRDRRDRITESSDR
ncbi:MULTISPECIES: hypothetical protein [unclassified Streptomyces]|uniref:hypothetical protein n=1 Tax=unclassified Streptomyces TaxID=2593676 RepID=UPI00224F420C|nr:MULTISPECIES: hypothetical protein [unclassified Streptomyces]MCX4628064.1 hypothetical protein [Streptomyces sp. NBC_01443]MCX5145932.1 hypothetical protein [Streptomyces sp. NBC_00320]WSN49170.1 hypothetical protein OG299_16490 [Streptomyces sp. NBC_01296]WSW61427.1 hypothetical protein OG513_24160 [Streptomyces sp. NBC_00998]